MENVALRLIQTDFFARIPFRCASINEHMNFIADNQESVLNCTIFHELNKKYPLKKSHQISFIKGIITSNCLIAVKITVPKISELLRILPAIEQNITSVQLLELMGIEVSEKLYLTYVNLTSLSDGPDSHYVHISIDILLENEYISIKEKGEVISNGTTGLAVWEAGKVLSKYCVKHESAFRNKNILELGSGLGLCGLSVIRVCQPNMFCFSDCHDEVLEYLVENIRINLNPELIIESQIRQNDAVVLSGTYKNTRVVVLKLNWQDLLSKVQHIFKPDLIVAADIVYDLSTIPSLGEAIAGWLRLNAEAEVILSCTVRNTETFASFLSFIRTLDLEETIIETVQTWNMSFDLKYDVKILSIRCGNTSGVTEC